jgi:hypothetical protein
MLKPEELETLVAAADEATRWLATEMGRADLQLRLVDERTVKRDVEAFVARLHGRRKVQHWDWLAMFHKKVKYRNAWMFVVDGRRGHVGPRAMCWGKIEVRAGGYVSIEYVERRPYARMGGLTTVIAFRFAQVVAGALEVAEVRINEPFPELVPFYTAKLGVNRHPPTGRVKYLFKKV